MGKCLGELQHCNSATASAECYSDFFVEIFENRNGNVIPLPHHFSRTRTNEV